MNTSMPAPSRAIGLVGFDGDDTLWKSEDYYRKAEQDYLDLLSRYVDVHDTRPRATCWKCSSATWAPSATA